MSDLWVRFEGSKTAGRELVKAAAQGGAFPVAEEALFRLPAERRDDGLKAAIQEFARVGQPGQWLTIYGGRPLGRNPDRLIFLPESVEACLSYAEARQQTGAAMESLPDALPAPRPIVAITRPVARPAERVEPLHVHPVPMARKHRAPAPVRTREPVRKRRVGRRLLTIVASLALIGVGRCPIRRHRGRVTASWHYRGRAVPTLPGCPSCTPRDLQRDVNRRNGILLCDRICGRGDHRQPRCRRIADRQSRHR